MGRFRESKTEGHEFQWFGNNRFICDALADMRKCAETLNFSPMMSLIEEIQIMANRMEAGLSDKKDLAKLGLEISSARQAYKKLKNEYKALQKKMPKKNAPKS